MRSSLGDCILGFREWDYTRPGENTSTTFRLRTLRASARQLLDPEADTLSRRRVLMTSQSAEMFNVYSGARDLFRSYLCSTEHLIGDDPTGFHHAVSVQLEGHDGTYTHTHTHFYSVLF